MKLSEYDYDRFWVKVRKQRNGCLLWVSNKSTTGYGRFKLKGKNIRSHRLSWILANGEIPDGLLVLHKCDNPSCVNPEHLFLGTCQDNMTDMANKGRSTKGRACPEDVRLKIASSNRGRSFSEEHIRNLKIARQDDRKCMHGKFHSKETKQKMSAVKIGHFVSEETKRKISETKKRNGPPLHYRKQPIGFIGLVKLLIM